MGKLHDLRGGLLQVLDQLAPGWELQNPELVELVQDTMREVSEMASYVRKIEERVRKVARLPPVPLIDVDQEDKDIGAWSCSMGSVGTQHR